MDYYQAYQLGHNWLLKNPHPGKRDAIMFDIDDTLLLVNWGTSNLVLTPNQPIIQLLKEFHTAGYHIYIITARDFRVRNETMDDLKNNGIPFHELHMRYTHSDQHFKSDLKRELSKKGIRFVMSVGDQPIDVEGEYSGIPIKLVSRI